MTTTSRQRKNQQTTTSPVQTSLATTSPMAIVKARLEAQARKPVTPVNPFTPLLKQLAAVKEGVA